MQVNDKRPSAYVPLWGVRILKLGNGQRWVVSFKLHIRASEPIERIQISLARSIHRWPNFSYLFCPTRVSILWRIWVYIHIFKCTETVYELLLLSNNIASDYKYRERC